MVILGIELATHGIIQSGHWYVLPRTASKNMECKIIKMASFMLTFAYFLLKIHVNLMRNYTSYLSASNLQNIQSNAS